MRVSDRGSEIESEGGCKKGRETDKVRRKYDETGEKGNERN